MAISKAQFEEMQARLAQAKPLRERLNNKTGSDSPAPAPELPAPDKKRVKRNALERALSRKEESGPRFKIEFHVYAVRPCDYDGYHIKELQDLVVKSGIIPSDDWRTLRGETIPHKVYTEAEEETRILIIEL